MSRKRRNDGPERVFHITARVNWQAWHLDERAVRLQLARRIAEAAARFDVAILAYVLMANHFHLVCQSPPEPLFRQHTARLTACRHWRPWPEGHQNSSVIARFMKLVRWSMSVRRHQELGLAGQFWQNAYDARRVLDGFSLIVRIAYDHRNPVKAGIVDRPDDYEWSSASAWATGTSGHIPIVEHTEPLAIPRAVLREEVLRYQARQEIEVAMRDLEAHGLDWTSVAGIAALREALGGSAPGSLAG